MLGDRKGTPLPCGKNAVRLLTLLEFTLIQSENPQNIGFGYGTIVDEQKRYSISILMHFYLREDGVIYLFENRAEIRSGRYINRTRRF